MRKVVVTLDELHVGDVLTNDDIQYVTLGQSQDKFVYLGDLEVSIDDNNEIVSINNASKEQSRLWKDIISTGYPPVLIPYIYYALYLNKECKDKVLSILDNVAMNYFTTQPPYDGLIRAIQLGEVNEFIASELGCNSIDCTSNKSKRTWLEIIQNGDKYPWFKRIFI